MCKNNQNKDNEDKDDWLEIYAQVAEQENENARNTLR